ncbi:MAG: response regulator transcription factor [Myxococcales bacterium]
MQPARQRALTEINERLACLAGEDDHVLPDVVQALGRLLNLDLCTAYGITVEGQSFEPTIYAATPSFRPWMQDVWRAFVRGTTLRSPHGLFDPVRPESWQRNRALLVRELGRDPEEGPVTPTLRRLGMDPESQLRALLCDGPSLLAWIGGFREGPPGEDDRSALQALVPALRKRLRLERQLGEQRVRAAALPAALEALSAPAFLLGPSGRILHANAAGRALLESGGAEALAALRAGVGYSVTGVCAPGMPELSLRVREVEPVDLTPRLACTAARWGLSPREREVLALLARGAANRTIAVSLRVSEGTVEAHVTHLLSKAQVESRAALVARFWTQNGDLAP